MNQEQMEDMHYFEVVAEGIRNDIRQVVESQKVIRQELREFREEVQNEFKEVRSLIKFSYAELDQRINTVERELLSLKTRMERLEARQN